MMDSFSPTFKWIVPRTNIVMRDRSFSHRQKASLSHVGKGGRKTFARLLNYNIYNVKSMGNNGWKPLSLSQKMHDPTTSKKFRSSSHVPLSLYPGATYHMSCKALKKHTFWHIGPMKILIRLRIGAVWSESSLSKFWIAKSANLLHAYNEDWSDCADMRADLNLRLVHMSEGTISDVAAYTY